MSLDIVDIIQRHRSIRKYKSNKVPDELLNKILQAGLRASSSGNMQSWSVVVTRDQNIRKTLFKPHFEQQMVLEAPVLMTFCSDFHRMRLWLKEKDAPDNFDNLMSFMIGAIDATLASQNIALAAESEGLGVCYMGTTLASCYEIAEILKLPHNVVPVVGYVLGYPNENPPLRDRLPLEGIVHYETYSDYPSKEILEIYKEREIKGWKRYMENSDFRELVEKHKVQNLAQIYTILKYTQESHKRYSQNILKCLVRQDFSNND